MNRMSKKFKIKTIKEINEEWKENWEKFKTGFNDFFGIPPKNQFRATTHNTKETAIDVTPEELREEQKQPEQNQEKMEVTSYQAKLPSAKEQWDQNWKIFSENTMVAFDDMRQKINDWNQKNLDKWQEQIKIGKANYKIWLKKQELKNYERKQQQELAMQRFQQWVKESGEKNRQYFEDQQKQWKTQLEQWKTEQQELREKNREKWEKNRQKFRTDYENWIKQKRERSLEKAKYRLRVGWRTNLYILMSILPAVIIIVLIIAIINAVMGR